MFDAFKLRRSSYNPNNNQEPLIVVEESGNVNDDETLTTRSSPRYSLDIESPVNPYLLTPWQDPRETRKHSLPTPQCTTGITASQVRRLSEQGGDGAGLSPQETSFLTTLSQAAAPSPGGRRHSVVTISKMPSLSGGNRRESIAAFPTMTRILGYRRDSGSQGPPSTDPRGSIHNLQLDKMDDIVQTKKARMKLWNTSTDKIAETPPIEEAKSPMNRRYSDFIGASLNSKRSFRRASEYPCVVSPSIPEGSPSTSGASGSASKKHQLGILLSLTSSATEINKCDDQRTLPKTPIKAPLTPSQHRKSIRSNSFDLSNSAEGKPSTLTGWFDKRHKPISKKKPVSTNPVVTFSMDIFGKFTDNKSNKDTKKQNKTNQESSKFSTLKKNCKSAIVDVHSIGSALEGFFRSDTNTSNKGAIPKDTKKSNVSTASTSSKMSNSFWFNKNDETDTNTDNCESSLCNTLKDLFWANSQKSENG